MSLLFRNLPYHLIAGLLIVAPAFMNGYPLVFSDSGTYIWNSFTLSPAADRPIGYSFIIRAVTWQSSLWPLIVFQGAMASGILFHCLKRLLPTGTVIWRFHLPVIACLLVTTSMPWYAAQVMPDILTPLIPLVFFLLLTDAIGPWPARYLLWTCLFFFLLAHFSHVAMMVALIVVVLLFLWRRSALGNGRSLKFIVAGLITVAVMLFGAWYNGLHGLRGVYSPTTHVYLAARLCEMDVMHDFLQEHCGRKDYVLCPYKDELPSHPSDFIWSGDGILAKMDVSMSQADTLLRPLVHDVLTHPPSLFMYLRSVAIGTVIQLFGSDAGSGLGSYAAPSAPHYAIERHLPWELKQFENARQNTWGWDLELFNKLVHVVLLASLVFIALQWKQARSSRELQLLVVIIISWIFFNALITAGMANVYDRLQSRVNWLLMFLALVMFIRDQWFGGSDPIPLEDTAKPEP